jgi:hypothetical protein
MEDDPFDFAAIVREVQGSASSAASPAGIDVDKKVLSRARIVAESYAVRGVRVDTGLLLSILETEFGFSLLTFRARVAEVLAEVQRAAPQRPPSPPITHIAPLAAQEVLLGENENDESSAPAPRRASSAATASAPPSRVAAAVTSTSTKRARQPSPPSKSRSNISRAPARRDAESDADVAEEISDGDKKEEEDEDEDDDDDDDSAYSDDDDDDNAIIIVDSDTGGDEKQTNSATPKKSAKTKVLTGKGKSVKKETPSITPAKKPRPTTTTTGRTGETGAGAGAGVGAGAGAGAGAGVTEETHARGPKHSATLPLLLPKSLKSRSTLLVQIEDSKFDLSGAYQLKFWWTLASVRVTRKFSPPPHLPFFSGDVGAIGRLTVIPRSGVILDLKGVQYVGTVVPSCSFFVVGLSGDTAKIESHTTDFLQLEHVSNMLDSLSGALMSGGVDAALLKFDDVMCTEAATTRDTDDEGGAGAGAGAGGGVKTSAAKSPKSKAAKSKTGTKVKGVKSGGVAAKPKKRKGGGSEDDDDSDSGDSEFEVSKKKAKKAVKKAPEEGKLIGRKVRVKKRGGGKKK